MKCLGRICLKLHGFELFIFATLGVVVGFVFIPQFAILCGIILIYLIIDALVDKIHQNNLQVKKKSIIPRYHPDYNFFS
ncbi:hypothetical protein WKT22_00763 [Candidatus Lokiarchaeum ossiferum]